MLDNETIDLLTREARPRDFAMLRSYIRRGHSAQYVRRVMIPSLRRLHPAIWTCVQSQSVKA